MFRSEIGFDSFCEISAVVGRSPDDTLVAVAIARQMAKADDLVMMRVTGVSFWKQESNLEPTTQTFRATRGGLSPVTKSRRELHRLFAKGH